MNNTLNGIEQVADELETLLVMAMEEMKPEVQKWQDQGRLSQRKYAHDYFRFDDATPSSAYTFDAMDKDRVFAGTTEYLLYHPADTIGSGAEIYYLSSSTIKWMRIEPARKPSRGFASVGKADKWFCVHFREGSTKEGWTGYTKGYLAINAAGKSIPVRFMHGFNLEGFQGRNDMLQIPLTCSIIEDAHRKNAVIARVKENVEIIFPVCADAYKDFFLLRDGPRETPTGKRNPILHWVKKHIRHVGEKKAVEVRDHLRGRDEIVINGISLSIELNR